jgi:hypothetical protein
LTTFFSSKQRQTEEEATPSSLKEMGEENKFSSRGALYWTAPDGLPPPLDSKARREA